MFAVHSLAATRPPRVSRRRRSDGSDRWVALPGSIQGVPPEQLGIGQGLAPGPAVLVMLVWIAALWGAGAALLCRRDVG